MNDSTSLPTERLRSLLLDKMPHAFALCKVVRTPGDEFSDLIVIDANAEFIRQSGFENKARKLEGTSLRQLAPRLDQRYPELIASFKRAVTGDAIATEIEIPELGKFFQVMVLSPAPEVLAIVLEDLTRQKSIERELRTSEQRLRTIINNEPECVKILDRDCHLVTVNRAGLKLLGVGSMAEIKNFTMLDYIAPEYRARFEKFKNLIFEGDSAVMEAEVISPGKQRAWLEIHAVPLKDNDGQIRTILTINRDITSRKDSEAEVGRRHELERRIATIAETAPGALCSFAIKPDGTALFPYVSPLWEEFFGLRQEQVSQSAAQVFARIHPDDLPSVQKSIELSARTMTPWRAEFRIQTPQKGDLWIEGHSKPYREADGTIIWHGFITEITERKSSSEALLAAKNTAESAAKAQATFLDIAAHELRNPISSLSLLLQLIDLKMREGHPPSPDLLKRLKAPAGRLASLVKDLLDLSRLERGILVPRMILSDLGQLIQASIDEMRLQAPDHEFSFEAPKEPIPVRLDPVRITQVLTNLLDNAVKYTPPHTRIQVTLERKPGIVRVNVIDNGPGISKDVQERLFSAFARGTSEATVRSSGLGLGLSIARRIINLHEGKIGVQSAPQKGARFYFELPVGSEGQK